MAYRSKPLTISLTLTVAITLLALIVSFLIGSNVARGEQAGSSPDSGVTSRVKSLYTTLQSAGYGSDTNTPNWGTYWNRISTASQWVPGGTATIGDVVAGKTFYGNSRTLLTGTGGVNGVCSTQQYHDGYGVPVTQTTNCTDTITWTTPTDGITGTDKQDPKSNLIWSQPLINSAGTVAFTTGVGSTWTWDASGANNVAVGNKTASQLCSERGNGWRLPSQKELMHAYVDGSNFNLVSPGSLYWSRTESSATYAWYVVLSYGGTGSPTKTNTLYVRCVR
jgi:hypothetical protein